MEHTVVIGKRFIGSACPCFIIAEAGVNHNGNMDIAHRLIDDAAMAGVDCVKFQSFITDRLVVANTPVAAYQTESGSSWTSQYEMLKVLELTEEQQLELKRHCDSRDIEYLCTPYDEESLDALDRMGVKAFKIASTDTNNLPFLRQAAKRRRPILLSTGMATLGEVDVAVTTLREYGLNDQIVLMHCTGQYPAPIVDCNLRAMLTMKRAFACEVGFSDHTSGIGATPWAVALGAVVIEKHFTIDKSLSGPDHKCSLSPSELNKLVITIRSVESALGDGIKRPMPSELENKRLLRRSLVLAENIAEGDIFEVRHLACKRPGLHLSPEWYDRVLGQRACKNLQVGHFLRLQDISWSD